VPHINWADVWPEIIAGLSIALVLFFVDRGARLVSETIEGEHTGAEAERHAQHALRVWAWGLEEDGEGRPGIPGFVNTTWPEFETRFTEVETVVTEELRHNGGGSMKDELHELVLHLRKQQEEPTDASAPAGRPES
jgi:hypothetical protein